LAINEKNGCRIGCEQGIVQAMVVKNLTMRSFKRRTVHPLNPKFRQMRHARCKALKRRLTNLNQDNVLYSDENFFTIEQSSNSQNDRILSTSSSDIPEHLRMIDRNHRPASIMVWGSLSRNHRTKLIFLPSGVKINATSYRDRILEPVLKKCGRNLFDDERWTPTHTTRMTQEWLKREILDFISKQEWPRRVQTLTSLTFVCEAF
jgi:hypothetical protein